MREPLLYQLTVFLLFICLMVTSLMFAKNILAPLGFAALFTFFMRPLAQRLETLGLNRLFASLLCIVFLVTFMGSILIFFTAQIKEVAMTSTHAKATLFHRLEAVGKFFAVKTEFTTLMDWIAWIRSNLPKLVDTAIDFMQNIFSLATVILLSFLLTMLYTFFLLLYRERIFTFLIKESGLPKNIQALTDIIQDRISHYLSGVTSVIAILSLLNSIGLMFIGIPQPFLWGTFASVLNVIPYIGNIVGSLILVSISFLFGHTLWQPVALIGLLVTTQLIDGYFLTPYLIGHQKHLNPLIIIIGVGIGTLIWGIPGAVLAIPIMGILKVLSEHTKGYKPFSYLMDRDETSFP